jgi:hypothetical protein
MTSGTHCPLLWPLTTPCSGHGTCLTITTINSSSSSSLNVGDCECFEGYISLGDFATQPGADCDLNILAIRVLYGITILPSLISLILSVRYLMLKREAMNESSSKKLKWSDLINSIPVLAIIANICLIGMASIKIYNPELGVGTSLVVTILFSIMFQAFWIIQLGYLYLSLQMTAIQARIKSAAFQTRLELQLERLQKFLIFVFIVSFIWGLAPLIMLFVPSSVNIVGPIHYIGGSFNIAVLSFMALPRTLFPIRNDIREAIKDDGLAESSARAAARERMEIIERKLTFLFRLIQRNAVPQTIVACVFALWPYLLRKASYQLPVTWITATIVLAFEVYSISNFSKPLDDSKRSDSKTLKSGSLQGAIVNSKDTQDNLDLSTIRPQEDNRKPSLYVDDHV